jgi:hypothetical protein
VVSHSVTRCAASQCAWAHASSTHPSDCLCFIAFARVGHEGGDRPGSHIGTAGMCKCRKRPKQGPATGPGWVSATFQASVCGARASDVSLSPAQGCLHHATLCSGVWPLHWSNRVWANEATCDPPGPPGVLGPFLSSLSKCRLA